MTKDLNRCTVGTCRDRAAVRLHWLTNGRSAPVCERHYSTLVTGKYVEVERIDPAVALKPGDTERRWLHELP